MCSGFLVFGATLILQYGHIKSHAQFAKRYVAHAWVVAKNKGSQQTIYPYKTQRGKNPAKTIII